MLPIILLFPGQASQYVGMGRGFYEGSPAARDFFDCVVRFDGLQHLPKVIWEGPDELLTRTDNVQPAMTIVSLMALAALHERLGVDFKPLACAGHSLGEYAAHYAAGNLSLEQTLTLVRWRGCWMNEAAQPPNPKGGMVAVMGLALEDLESLAAEIGRDKIAVANLNSPGQVIVSGEAEAIFQAVQRAQAAGAKRCIPLNVSGAWHSPLMLPAQQKMAELIGKLITAENTTVHSTPVVAANATGGLVRSVQELRDTLIRQITSPVRWMECIDRLLKITTSEAPPLFLEVGPGKVLKGLLKNIDRYLEVMNVEDMTGLEDVYARLRV